MQPEVLSNYPRGPILAENNYILKRHLIKLVGGRFSIYSASGALALLADQKGFKLKEEIRVYSDEQMTQPYFGIFARQIMDFSAAYDVVDLTNNTKIGALKRKGWHSMVRDEWIIMDPYDREIGTVVEDSMLMALLRRFLSNLIPQNYDAIVGQAKVVDFRQTFNPFAYNLHIDFLATPESFDRRLGFAAAVLLAAIEGRQKG